MPNLSLIILPESATQSCPPSCIIPMIIGSFEPHATYRFNTLYYLSENKKTSFHKKFPVPFAEYIPSIIAYDWITQLMHSKNTDIRPSTNRRPQWHINSEITLIPYICSELFGSHLPDDPYTDTILVACNDLWFTPHFKFLMSSTARLRALQWHRPIIYVSYAYGQFFDQFGNIHPIATSNL